MKQGQKTKALILEESNRLFYINGYNSTSFGDIEKATKLSKGNITYHFKTKKAILEGIVEKRLQEIENLAKEWELKTQNSKERLSLFCDMIIDNQNSIKSYGCPMGTLTAEFSKNEPTLYSVVLPLFTFYKNWLTKEYELLGLNNKKAKEEAMSLLAKVQGVAMVTHAFKDKKFLILEIGKIKNSLDV